MNDTALRAFTVLFAAITVHQNQKEFDAGGLLYRFVIVISSRLPHTRNLILFLYPISLPTR